MIQHSDIENRFSSAGGTNFPRQLYIKFDVYTEGDQQYKKELGSLIIANLTEFQQSLTASVQQNDPGLFLGACHKVKVTLSMLEDQEFNAIIEELEKRIVNAGKDNHFIILTKKFQHICNLIIAGLMMEINHPGTK